MDSISFTNFRRFADFPNLIFKPITFLVGGNNSGKSTLIKAIILCLDNLRTMRRGSWPTFDFSANKWHDVKVSTNERAFRDTHEKMTFSFDINGWNFRYDLICENIYVDCDPEEAQGAEVSRIEISNNEMQIIINSEDDGFYCDIHDAQKKQLYTALISVYEEEKEKLNSEDFEPTEEFITKLDGLKAALRRLLTEYVTHGKGEDNDKEEESEDDLDLDELIQKFKDDDCPAKVISSEGADVGDDNTLRGAIARIEEEADMKLNLDDEIDALLNTEIDFIPVHTIHQNSVYLTSDKSDYIAQTLHSLRLGDEGCAFIEKYMGKDYFGIGKSFRVEELEGSETIQILDKIGGAAYKVYITTEAGKEVNLADMGIGSIQLMVLLFRLVTIINKKGKGKRIVILEEPEQNLHPRLQSLLADLFLDLYTKYGLQVIVETHSEYLIRKTQVLVKKDNFRDDEDLISHCPFAVYYFTGDDKQPVRTMKYRTDGIFENDFGPGFFDESEKLAFEVL